MPRKKKSLREFVSPERFSGQFQMPNGLEVGFYCILETGDTTCPPMFFYAEEDKKCYFRALRTAAESCRAGKIISRKYKGVFIQGHLVSDKECVVSNVRLLGGLSYDSSFRLLSAIGQRVNMQFSKYSESCLVKDRRV